VGVYACGTAAANVSTVHPHDTEWGGRGEKDRLREKLVMMPVSQL
jgi:hypothetical protein